VYKYSYLLTYLPYVRVGLDDDVIYLNDDGAVGGLAWCRRSVWLLVLHVLDEHAAAGAVGAWCCP